MKRHYRKYTNDDIVIYSKEVKSLAGLLKKLGLKPSGGNYDNIRRKISKLKIDTSHWTGQAWNKNQRTKDWNKYVKNSNLKSHLIKERGAKCEHCSLTIWVNRPIPLELHHIDGNRINNNKDNLQLLCPNCHSLTDNFRNKKHL